MSKSFKTRHSYQIYFYLHFYSFVFMTLTPIQSFSLIRNARSSEERGRETENERFCWNKSWGFWTSIEKQIYQLSCYSLHFGLNWRFIGFSENKIGFDFDSNSIARLGSFQGLRLIFSREARHVPRNQRICRKKLFHTALWCIRFSIVWKSVFPKVLSLFVRCFLLSMKEFAHSGTILCAFQQDEQQLLYYIVCSNDNNNNDVKQLRKKKCCRSTARSL